MKRVVLQESTVRKRSADVRKQDSLWSRLLASPAQLTQPQRAFPPCLAWRALGDASSNVTSSVYLFPNAGSQLGLNNEQISLSFGALLFQEVFHYVIKLFRKDVVNVMASLRKSVDTRIRNVLF